MWFGGKQRLPRCGVEIVRFDFEGELWFDEVLRAERIARSGRLAWFRRYLASCQ